MQTDLDLATLQPLSKYAEAWTLTGQLSLTGRGAVQDLRKRTKQPAILSNTQRLDAKIDTQTRRKQYHQLGIAVDKIKSCTDWILINNNSTINLFKRPK